MKRKPVRRRKATTSPSSRVLAPTDPAKRREILIQLMAENRSAKEIRARLGISAGELTRLMRETPELQDEIHAIVQANSIVARPAVLGMRLDVMENSKDDRARLEAGKDIEFVAGVHRTKQDGLPTIIIMGREVNVQAARPQDLEAVLRKAARKLGDPDVVKHVDATIAGTPLAVEPESGETE